MNTLSEKWGELCQIVFVSLLERGFNLKGKNLLTFRNLCFPFRVDPGSQGVGVSFPLRLDRLSCVDWCTEPKQNVTKVVPLLRNGGKVSSCIKFPYN